MAIRDPDEAAGPGRAAPAGEPSDQSLLRRFQHGHEDASTELYLRYSERLLALVAAGFRRPGPAVDPEDIVQSVFRTFFRRASLGHYTVPDGDEIWKLFLVIALNKVRAIGSFHRAAKRDVRRTAGGESFDRAVESESGRDERPSGSSGW